MNRAEQAAAVEVISPVAAASPAVRESPALPVDNKCGIVPLWMSDGTRPPGKN